MFRCHFIACSLIGCLTACSVGCSTLGISLFPTGHFFTDQTEAVVQATPSPARVSRERAKDVLPVHYLEPGDVLLIEPISLETNVRIPADQRVMADGSVDLGAYGRVVIAGLSIETAESLIERTIVDLANEADKLTMDNVDINVRLIEPTHRYYVLGEVNSPGTYSLEGFETVLDGILQAGGLTTAASTCNIILSRPTDPCSCRVTLPICYRELTQMGDTSTNYQLKPGDRIYVATRSCSEELKFWKANEPCEKCCRCQSACGDASVATPINALAGVIAAPVPPTDIVLQPHNASMIETDGYDDAANQSSALPSPVDSSVPADRPIPQLRDPSETRGPSTIETEPLPGNNGNAVPEADGELDIDLDIRPRSSRRFTPTWLK